MVTVNSYETFYFGVSVVKTLYFSKHILTTYLSVMIQMSLQHAKKVYRK